MATDLKYLREHYASLSDEALLAIDRSDLVDAAQRCYDDELMKRELVAGRRPVPEANEAEESDFDGPDQDVQSGNPDEPDWLEDAAEVYSRLDRPGALPGGEIADARDALEAAGIPCYVELEERPPEPPVSAGQTHLWRVLVPGNLNLRATSVLDRDIFNPEFEQTWKAHLETLSDAELRQMTPEIVFCGLFDKIERVTKAYQDELAHRRLRR